MSSPQSLSVVLSFYNEAQVIPELVSRLRAMFGALLLEGELAWYELIFVNDTSTDNSREILEQLAGDRGDIRILNMSRNFGVSPCVMAGMEHASGDIVVYMDADLQDPPETIPSMLKAMRAEKVDVVHTVRLSRPGETWVKMAITRLGYWILSHVSTIPLQIEAGDFKLLSRRAVNHLVNLREKRPFMRGLVCWIGFPQTTVYYHREARFAGKTKFLVLGPKVITNFLSSALISFSDVPLQFASWFGALLSLLSIIYASWLGWESMKGHEISNLSIGLVIFELISGVQLFSIGLLGLYVSSIHVESKRRPNYILESKFGFPDSKTGGRE